MVKIIIGALLLFATTALGAERVIINPDVDGNIKIKVNDGGVVTDAITVTGSDAIATLGVGLKLPSSGATPSTLNFYAESTFSSTATWDGSGATSSSQTVEVYRVGKIVHVLLPIYTASTGTNSSTLTLDTALPTWARPSTGDAVAVGNGTFFYSGSVFVGATVWVNDSGFIYLRRHDWANLPNSTSVTTNNFISLIFPI